jgi:hypothetical protein
LALQNIGSKMVQSNIHLTQLERLFLVVSKMPPIPGLTDNRLLRAKNIDKSVYL